MSALWRFPPSNAAGVASRPTLGRGRLVAPAALTALTPVALEPCGQCCPQVQIGLVGSRVRRLCGQARFVLHPNYRAISIFKCKHSALNGDRTASALGAGEVGAAHGRRPRQKKVPVNGRSWLHPSPAWRVGNTLLHSPETTMSPLNPVARPCEKKRARRWGKGVSPGRRDGVAASSSI